MGSSCSMQREQYESFRDQQRRNRNRERREIMRRADSDGTRTTRSSLRHSVVSAIPDRSIAALYPVEDNYVNVAGNRRSPKSLAALATEALCRSLPNLEGELPPGLPQDVVDDIFNSLFQHSALTATTLRCLKNCELRSLSLAQCRGFTDDWLSGWTSGSCSPVSLPTTPPRTVQGVMDRMDVDLDEKPGDIFYGSFSSPNKFEDSSCSTSSFVSAASNHHALASSSSLEDVDQLMIDNSPCSLDGNAEIPFMDETEVSGTKCGTFHSPRSEDPVSPLQEYNPTAYDFTPFESFSVTNNLTLLDFRGSQRLSDRGLLQLTNLQRLEVARFDNCHTLTGRGLLALSNSHRLHTLSLANCRRLTDEAIINISHILSLEALSLDGCRCLTDRSLAAISGLYNLMKLDLSQCDLITDQGLEQLEQLEQLQEFSIGWCRQVSDVGIQTLTSQPERSVTLQILRLARLSITDEGVDYLSRLTALKELDLNGCSNISSAALGNTLDKLKKLEVLDVSYCPGILLSNWQWKINALKTLELSYSSVKDSHLTKFQNLTSLQELNLDSCPVGDTAIAHLADNEVVPNLTCLDLADTNLTDLGMAKIAKFSKLTRLSLFYCNITNGGLRHIAKLSELEVLNLDSREVSDEGLLHLRNMTKLRSLDVFSGRVTDSGCSYIAKISSLESLELCGGGIGDLGCTLLASLENLTSLNLSQNERITNRGAAALATLSNLKALNLSNTRVSSSALRFFSGLKKLQSLALYGCRGIEDERIIGNLQNGLPNLKCLRLNTSSDEEGMMLTDDASSSDDISSDGGVPHHRMWAAMARDTDDDTSEYSDHD